MPGGGKVTIPSRETGLRPTASHCARTQSLVTAARCPLLRGGAARAAVRQRSCGRFLGSSQKRPGSRLPALSRHLGETPRDDQVIDRVPDFGVTELMPALRISANSIRDDDDRVVG